MYNLNEQQQQKLEELKGKLKADAYSTLQAKIEKLKPFLNAEQRINNFLSKDIEKIKRALSIEKSKAKKAEIEEIVPYQYIAEICNVVKAFNYSDICKLIEKLEAIKETNKKKYIEEIDLKISKAEEELDALKKLKLNI